MTTKKPIPLSILEDITSGFSVDSIIGTGGYGNVYKGVYEGRDIAVKLLHIDTVEGLDDEQFKNEVGNLLKVKHPNIVQIVGYCYETTNIYVERNGANNFSQHIYRIICFEYLQGGSLDKHLCDKSFAPCWRTRYNIIKGICEGLNFLHKCNPPICHLDLKPANILLDSYMEPKLADFGLSRIFTPSHTHVTEKVTGTRKYMPPEFIGEQKMSLKNDVFSLGVVMIEIMIGPAGYSNSLEMDDRAQLTQQVLDKWSTMIEPTSKYRSGQLHQVKTCIDLAMHCVDSDKDNRPIVADILDTLNKTETGVPKKEMANVLLYPTIGPRSTEPHPMKTMVVEPDNITNRCEHCSYTPTDSSNRSVHQVLNRETASDVDEEFIIGRTEEKQKILSILSESSTEVILIVPIYGIGGIGKTTLAQLVFNDTQFKGYTRVWVYVSKEFNLNKIGNSIISQLTNKTSDISDKQMLHTCLKKLFTGTILIVLDDLWEDNQAKLFELMHMLSLGLGRKLIIVTTRDGGLTNKIVPFPNRPLKLDVLTTDICWTIIKQKSSFECRHDKQELEQIGRDIAAKCGGVALAAQSLGYMLTDKSYDEWESVRDSNFWNRSTLQGPSSGNNQVLQSLRLSYSHMSYYLKLCFSYCAVFPKGHNIVMCNLFHQWIALGFIEPSEVFDSMQLCKQYVTQLLGMSFLQHSKAPPSGELKGKDLFTMHDLVHDLARAMLADKVNEKGNDVGSSCHYAVITDCGKPLQWSPENIKAMFFLDPGKIELLGGAFSPAKCLRVLDFSECGIQKLPDSIGRLKQLRYLHAPRIGDKMIPSCVTVLLELNYLNLRGSRNISALPESIGDMKRLMHLDLSGCVEIRELPLSFVELKQLVHLDLSLSGMSVVAEALGGCTELQYLNLSGCVRVSELPKSFVALKKLVHLDLSLCSISGVEALVSCTKLQYLNLSGCERIHELPISFAELKQLVHLDLSLSRMSVLAEALGGCTKLQYLNLSGCQTIRELPKSFAELKQLVHLDLSLCNMSISKEFGGFTKLQYLNLSADDHIPAPSVRLLGTINNLTNLRYLNLSQRMLSMDDEIDSISTMSNLEHLDLSHSYWLPRLPESIVNLRNLHTLDLSGCSDLEKLPDTIDKMASLKVLNVTGCSSLDESPLPLLNCALLPHFEVQASSTCSSNISLLQLANPDVLIIDKLENVKSVEEAQSIKLVDKHKIEKLKFQWTVTADRFVDDREVLKKLVPPSSIRVLFIGGYMSVNIPGWLMVIGKHLRNLSHIDLSEFPKCKNLPPLGQLPNLLELGLYYMKSLEEWNTGYISCDEGANEVMFPKLERLIIDQCPKLKLNGNTRQLTQLQELSLSGCGSIASLPEWFGELTSLKKIEIEDCPKLELNGSTWQLTQLQELSLSGCGSIGSLPEWFGELTSLKKIEIRDCPKLELNESTWQLTQLQELSLSACGSIGSLPEWFGELTSLMKIEIENCEGISSFPDSIQQLTKLEHLGIHGCPTLEKWCESEMNKWKLPHITKVITSSDVVRSVVMNTPGFTKEALGIAASHLKYTHQGSAYMSVHNQHQELLVTSFLTKRNTKRTTIRHPSFRRRRFF